MIKIQGNGSFFSIIDSPKTTMSNVIFTAVRILAKQEVYGGLVGGIAFRAITSVFKAG